jgi:hypothetical protein
MDAHIRQIRSKPRRHRGSGLSVERLPTSARVEKVPDNTIAHSLLQGHHVVGGGLSTTTHGRLGHRRPSR